jgi:hypothetical protein
VAIAHHVAQAGVVVRSERGRELVGRPSGLANRPERIVTLWAGELVFHLSKGCSNDVVMMDVRPDRLDGVEPDAMNEIEIARR